MNVASYITFERTEKMWSIAATITKVTVFAAFFISVGAGLVIHGLYQIPEFANAADLYGQRCGIESDGKESVPIRVLKSGC